MNFHSDFREAAMECSIGDELQGVDLNDKRLNRRAKQLLETLAGDPAAMINSACNGWEETMAAYRFFNNPKVQPEKLLQPHIEATKQRINCQPVVLLVQDTTELDYIKHPPRDAGVLNREDRFGLYDHTTLAVTPERLCLGVVNVELYDRTPESLGRAQERSSDPIETKESYRWLKSYRRACELAVEHPETEIISVGDAEADIYDIYVDALQQKTPAEFLVRARVERSLPEKDTSAGGDVYYKVRDEVANSKLKTIWQVDLPRTQKRAARCATMEVRAASVTVKPPHARSSLPEVQLQVVLVEEINGPQDGTDVCWLLITSLPVKTLSQIQQVVEYYTARWSIEVYFRTLKTGCKVERMQLETKHRQRNALMLYKIAAWRVMYLTFLGRECPELPADVLFSEAEWKSVWQIVEREPPPAEVPLLGDFLPVLAQLGGYNRRAGDAPPGPQAIWVALRRMSDFALAWQTFHPPRE
jgi:hypothetical protein